MLMSANKHSYINSPFGCTATADGVISIAMYEPKAATYYTRTGGTVRLK
jgi:hypothetical protein